MSAAATASDLDLWPVDLEPKGAPAPAAILRQQGFRLGERTRDIVYGDVESRFDNGKFVHTMYLSASYLKLRQPVVGIEHQLHFPYPAKVFSLGSDGACGAEVNAKSAEELADILRDFFKDPTIHGLIQALLAQTRDLDADE